MIHQAILLVSCLLLVAFAVEKWSRTTGIPAVVVLIGIGVALKPLLRSSGVELVGVDAAMPLLGTIGLVLIVLEGAFDLQLRREQLRGAAGALASAVLGLALWCAFFAAAGVWIMGLAPFDAFLLAMPFSVISSAVAISASSFLPARGREFVVYESSVSDILGILIFFAALDSDRTMASVLSTLGSSGLTSMLLGGLCAIGLLLGLVRLSGHIRFIPLLAGLFVLYTGGKLMHLSPLIMVLMFGLILNNPHLLARFGFLRRLTADPEFSGTVQEFKSLTAELTFAVRGGFFVLLGYWTDLAGFMQVQAWLAAGIVLLGIYGIRRGLLRLLRIELAGPLTWIAPRGLITVLLYLSAKEVVEVPAYVDGAVMLIVIASAVLIGAGRWQLGHVAAVSQDGAAIKRSTP